MRQSVKSQLQHHDYLKGICICHQPNCRFNADANMGHRFAILMAHVGALRASRSGAG